MKSTTLNIQGKKFTEAARALSCDEDEGKFNAALGKVAKHKPRVSETAKSAALRKKGDDNA